MAAVKSISANLPGHLIRRLHQFSTHIFMQRMRESGSDLTPIQFAALDAVLHNPGIDQAGLAQATAKDRATIGKVVDRLVFKGFLTRTISNRDKRARELTLTGKGKTVVAALIPIVVALQKETLLGLDEAEYEQFIKLAKKAVIATKAE